MQNYDVLRNLTDEELRPVSGGDCGAIYGTNRRPDPEQTFVEVTFTEAPPSTNGGAIYFAS